MSLLSKLFGGGSDSGDGRKGAEPEIYKDFRIFPDPVREAGGHRVAARIEKEVDGETRIHRMIRADLCTAEDEAREISARKARLLIDEQGERLFG